MNFKINIIHQFIIIKSNLMNPSADSTSLKSTDMDSTGLLFGFYCRESGKFFSFDPQVDPLLAALNEFPKESQKYAQVLAQIYSLLESRSKSTTL